MKTATFSNPSFAGVTFNVEAGTDLAKLTKEVRDANVEKFPEIKNLNSGTIKRVLEKQVSSSGWVARIVLADNTVVDTPFSTLDAKKYQTPDFLKEVVEDVVSHVPEKVAAVAAEAAVTVVEVEELDDPSNEGVEWLTKKNCSEDITAVREGSKVYEIIKALKKHRMTQRELFDYLYKIGFEEVDVVSKLLMAFYDIMRKGYIIGRIGKNGDDNTVYVLRNKKHELITGEILVYSSKRKDKEAARAIRRAERAARKAEKAEAAKVEAAKAEADKSKKASA